jgi:hypothetical protein
MKFIGRYSNYSLFFNSVVDTPGARRRAQGARKNLYHDENLWIPVFTGMTMVVTSVLCPAPCALLLLSPDLRKYKRD